MNDWLVVGRLNSSFGVRGWIKLESFTEPKENLFSYGPWRLNIADSAGGKSAGRAAAQRQRLGLPTDVEIEDVQQRGESFVVKLTGVESKEQAAQYAGLLIEVPGSSLPEAPEGDYYWHQLEGLEVVQKQDSGAGPVYNSLGRVDHLLETGANDVLVVRGAAGELLIPYLPGSVVLEVDLVQGRIVVDWHDKVLDGAAE